jgi:hypothetical protein
MMWWLAIRVMKPFACIFMSANAGKRRCLYAFNMLCRTPSNASTRDKTEQIRTMSSTVRAVRCTLYLMLILSFFSQTSGSTFTKLAAA